MPRRTDQPEPPGHAVYRSISDIPQPLRRLDDTPLSAEQASWINERAHALREERVAEPRISPEGDTVPGGVFHVENFQGAREEFRAAHEIVEGQWVARKKAVN